jgi:hypothetical protein
MCGGVTVAALVLVASVSVATAWVRSLQQPTGAGIARPAPSLPVTANSAAAVAPAFVAASESPVNVGRGSGGIFLVDLNGDGHLDLLTQHLMQNSIGVQLGDGTGQFTPLPGGPLKLDYAPAAVVVGDINGDHTPDLCIAARDDVSETIHILLGDGKGGFKPAGNSPLTMAASEQSFKPIVRLVDINGDGKLDLLYANGVRNTIAIMLGDGHGGFSSAGALKLAGNELYSFIAGDVDGDGRPDILATSNGGPNRQAATLTTMRGDGTGVFAAIASTAVDRDASAAGLADLNGDGLPDVVLTHGEDKRVSILLNSGHGTFSAAPGSPLRLPAAIFAVGVADVNHDGRPDLVLPTVHNQAKPYRSEIVVLLGAGNGRFEPAPGSPFAAGAGAYNAAIGDVNEDGKPDIAASSFEADAVTVLLGK